MILAGAFLLMTPFAHRGALSFVEALFTSTSATCVTGLIVKDTAKDFTAFGQLVILALIQVGGLGYMTIATFVAVFLRRKLSHRDQMILKVSLGHDTLAGIIRFLKRVFALVLILEGVGALFLSFRFSFDMPLLQAAWFGVFHSVSAFNNAGFSLFSDNLCSYRGDLFVNLVITTQIILGGIGYFVMLELYYFRQKELTRISTHTKVAVATTLFLIVTGVLIFLSLEWTNAKTIGSLAFDQKLLVSYFYSVNLRTSGYNTIDLSGMTDSVIFLSTILMVIGASPGGTGGGIKTTTFAVIVISMWHTLRGHSSPYVFRRTIPVAVVNQATTILLVASAYILLCTIVLSEIERLPFLKLLYEVASAFGTVGLSIGNGGVLSLSALFTDFGKLVIVFLMIAGRIGTLAFTVLLVGKIKEKNFQYVEGRIIL